MCMMTAPAEVSDTSIYVSTDGAQQTVLYQMKMKAEKKIAMILPIPGVLTSWVDTSKYPKFFEDLSSSFVPASRGGGGPIMLGSRALPVHKVGSYVATYVPTLDDFARVSPEFRLAPKLNLAKYGYDAPGWSFAVFAFDPECGGPEHAIGYRFQRGADFPDADALFVPTLHVHDGERADDVAHYDHHIYCSHVGEYGELDHYTKPDYDVVPESFQASRLRSNAAAEWFNPYKCCVRFTVKGNRPNSDTWLTHPSFKLPVSG